MAGGAVAYGATAPGGGMMGHRLERYTIPGMFALMTITPTPIHTATTTTTDIAMVPEYGGFSRRSFICTGIATRSTHWFPTRPFRRPMKAFAPSGLHWRC